MISAGLVLHRKEKGDGTRPDKLQGSPWRRACRARRCFLLGVDHAVGGEVGTHFRVGQAPRYERAQPLDVSGGDGKTISTEWSASTPAQNPSPERGTAMQSDELDQEQSLQSDQIALSRRTVVAGIGAAAAALAVGSALFGRTRASAAPGASAGPAVKPAGAPVKTGSVPVGNVRFPPNGGQGVTCFRRLPPEVTSRSCRGFAFPLPSVVGQCCRR
ncbi:hypothetical protein E143388_08175 [Rhodococcus opacus]|nr:hypothetical protein E143388_08175 [Rhodococcus opacus]